MGLKCLLGICLFLLVAGNGVAQQGDLDSIYSFSMQTTDGEQKALSDYKGKVLLIVNTASKCGFTPQLGSMEKLYQQYNQQGLEVLAFPANNFMGQEPGTDKEIKNFCMLTYNTTFPLFAKISVKGTDINPLYQYLTEKTAFTGPISWNFNKFLIDAQGQVVARYTSRVDPLSDEITKKIEELLAQ